MKKKSIMAISTIALGSTFSLIGCTNDFNVNINQNMNVYGPATYDENLVATIIPTSIKENYPKEVYEPEKETFSSNENTNNSLLEDDYILYTNPCVYGPKTDF